MKGGKRPPLFNKVALHAGDQRFEPSTAHHSRQILNCSAAVILLLAYLREKGVDFAEVTVRGL